MEPIIPDDPSDAQKAFEEMKQNLKSGEVRDKSFRKKQLDKLIAEYEKMIPELDKAYKKDLGYGTFMTNFTAHNLSLAEMKMCRNGIDTWTKPQKIDTPLASGLASSSI